MAAKPTRRAGEARVRTRNHPPTARRRDGPACWRGASAPANPGPPRSRRWIASVPRPPAFLRPLARFSPVLERAGSRVGRRPIAEGDAEWSAAERSALDAARGSTTLQRSEWPDGHVEVD